MEVYKNRDFIKNGRLSAVKKDFAGKVRPHRHEFFEIEYIIKGSGEYSVNGHTYEIKPNSLFFMTPADFHTVTTDDCQMINVMFSPEYAEAERLFSLISGGISCFEIIDDHDKNLILSLLTEIIRIGENNFIFTLKLLSCLLDKLADLNNFSVKTVPEGICKAVIFILNNFREGITLNSVAAEVGLAPVYLSSLFKKTMGVSFKVYLNNLQFDYAARLLEFSGMSVQEVCYNSGFTDYANFTRRFKERFYQTPAEYRKICK